MAAENTIDLNVQINGQSHQVNLGKDALVSWAANLSAPASPSTVLSPEVQAMYTDITPEPCGLLGQLAELSFKLYLKYHTETENDLKRIASFIDTHTAICTFYRGSQSVNPFWLIILIKLAYPQIGDDPVIENIGKFFWAIINKDSAHCDPASFFMLAMRLTNHMAEYVCNLSDYVKVKNAQSKSRSRAKHPDQWAVVRPAYEDYVKECTKGNGKHAFGYVFDAGAGSMCDNSRKLEHLLKTNGLWDTPTEDKTESEIRKKIYNHWQMTFKRTYEYEQNEKTDAERHMVEFFEKSFWKKITPEERLSKLKTQILQDGNNVTPEALSQLNSFIKNISLS